MELLSIIRTIELHRQRRERTTYTNWCIGRTNDLDRWKRDFPRRAQTRSFLALMARSARDAEAVVQHFDALGMRAIVGRRGGSGRQLYIFYLHPRRDESRAPPDEPYIKSASL